MKYLRFLAPLPIIFLLFFLTRTDRFIFNKLVKPKQQIEYSNLPVKLRIFFSKIYNGNQFSIDSVYSNVVDFRNTWPVYNVTKDTFYLACYSSLGAPNDIIFGLIYGPYSTFEYGNKGYLISHDYRNAFICNDSLFFMGVYETMSFDTNNVKFGVYPLK